MRWGFPLKFSVGLELGEKKDRWLGNLNGPPLGYVLRVSVVNFEMDPSSVMSEEILLETVRVMCSDHQMEDCLGGH